MAPKLRQALSSRDPSFWTPIVACLAFVVVAHFVLWTYCDLPFHSTRWKNEKDRRPQMVRDLLDNHDLAGKPRESIDAMLGVPPGCDSVRKASTFALTVPVGINYGPFRIN